jgi:magnesium-transporting ATPase (P-type)
MDEGSPSSSTDPNIRQSSSQIFHRNQTIEVLPRSISTQILGNTNKKDLFRSNTSDEAFHLHRRLLDSEEEHTSDKPTRYDDEEEQRRQREGSGDENIHSYSSRWRYYYRLPRPLRFRQVTRSRTKYIGRANAESLTSRLKAKKEEEEQDEEHKETDEYEDRRKDKHDVITPGSYLQQPVASTPSTLTPPAKRKSVLDIASKQFNTTPDTLVAASVANAGSNALHETEDFVVSISNEDPRPLVSEKQRNNSVFSVNSVDPHDLSKKNNFRIVKINDASGLEGRIRGDSGLPNDEEMVEVHLRDKKPFASNEVRTSQYTWWSFIPVFLYLTFQKTANLYFLAIGIFQMIPEISPTNGVPLQFLPLSIVTVIDAFFAAYEDYKRHIADHEANSAKTLAFNREMQQFEEIEWKDVKVGDLLKIFNREKLPADLLIMSVVSSEGKEKEEEEQVDTGICYVETKNLDGETNLKLREAPQVTRNMFDVEMEAGEVIHGFLESELPNGDINQYSGTLYIESDDPFATETNVAANSGITGVVGTPVTLKNMLLRGSKLRNTCCVYGLVVNTGVDTKIMMSSGDEFPVKISSIDEMTNRQVVIVVLILIGMSAIGTFGGKIWFNGQTLPKTMNGDDFDTNALGTFVYFFTTFASMVPITLYVSITAVKALQGYFMQKDLEMYDEENDCSMVTRNMQLNEQLGQITHIFSDKTGTLTCNKMEFRKCSINGVIYGTGTTAIGLAARMRDDYVAIDLDDDDDDNEKINEQNSPQHRHESRGIEDVEVDEGVEPVPNVNFKDNTIWKHLRAKDSPQSKKIQEFFTHLALCHSVLIEKADVTSGRLSTLSKATISNPNTTVRDNGQTKSFDVNNKIIYSASSPDEQALVSGAKYFGFEFVDRVPGGVSIRTLDDSIQEYDILEVFEFDSTRKRMTVIVQRRRTEEEIMASKDDEDKEEEEEVIVLCKGADNVLFPRIRSANDVLSEKTLKHIETFARDGLRTLVICSKRISMKEWDEFHMRYRNAMSDLDEVEAKNRGEKNAITQLQDEIEQDLELLGSTAIEDRLQAGVPETMEALAKAGICLWVLTGDMEETAINIGYACRLLNNDMNRHVISAARGLTTRGSILRRLDEIFHLIYDHGRKNSNSPLEASANIHLQHPEEMDTNTIENERNDKNSEFDLDQSHALVIDGASLNLILDDCHSNLHLLRVALLCRVVIACRVSPQQKAQLVELVKVNCQNSHTLSIGDGANDVPMIQSAHIGVGISGQEGMQAVNSSDYALGQFRFLAPLLLVHGRYNYNRVAMLTCYTFYKNIVYCVSMFWYTLADSAYSGTMLYSAFIQQGYNLFFTALPILVYAVWDRDVDRTTCMTFPILYHLQTRKRKMFSYVMFWKWIFLGVIDAIGVYYVTLATAHYTLGYKQTVDYTVLGSVGWTILCVVVNARFCLLVNSWDALEVGGVLISMLSLYGFQWAIDEIIWPPPDYDTMSFPWIFKSPVFWLGQLLGIVLILFKNFFYEGYRRRFLPDYADIVRETILLVKDPSKLQVIEEKLRAYKPRDNKYLKQELADMVDYKDRRANNQHLCRYTSPDKDKFYRGFAFDQPATIMNWILASASGTGGVFPLRRKSINFNVRQQILNSEDPVIFENERYQPFVGFGSTYPGHLLPTDRGRWSNRSGKISAMAIPLAGLEIQRNLPGADEDGWVYENDFMFFPSSAPSTFATSIQEEVDVHPYSPLRDMMDNDKKKSPEKSSKKRYHSHHGLVRRRQWVLAHDNRFSDMTPISLREAGGQSSNPNSTLSPSSGALFTDL